MKIFAVYINIKLIYKPVWFDSFREKYDEKYNLHITLIQPRFIVEDKIDEIKEKIEQAIQNNTFNGDDIKILFNKLNIEHNKPDDTYLFMLSAKENKTLIGFQSNLRSLLAGYGDYCDPSTEQYEQLFNPHITIARDLAQSSKKKAEAFFKGDINIVGKIETLAFPVVKNLSPEESKNPDNLTLFELRTN